MPLQPIPDEQIQPTIQNLLVFLDREDVMVPASMTESITSAKSLCRALIQGSIAICVTTDPPHPPVEGPSIDEVTKKKPPGKKKAA